MMMPNALANRLQSPVDPIQFRNFNPPATPPTMQPTDPIAHPVGFNPAPAPQQPQGPVAMPNPINGQPAPLPISQPVGQPMQPWGGQPPMQTFSPQPMPGAQPNYNALAQRLQMMGGNRMDVTQ